MSINGVMVPPDFPKGWLSHWQELSDRLLEPNAVTFNAAATACPPALLRASTGERRDPVINEFVNNYIMLSAAELVAIGHHYTNAHHRGFVNKFKVKFVGL